MKKNKLFVLVLLLFLSGCSIETNYSNTVNNTGNNSISYGDKYNETIQEQIRKQDEYNAEQLAKIEERQKNIKFEYYVSVKYREDPVNIINFDILNKSSNDAVKGAWYDSSNQYMIINLNGTKYHYCRFPLEIWNAFNLADSLYVYYKLNIKGHYDCRLGGIPSY